MHFSRKASSRLIFVGDDVDAFCMLLAGRSCLLSPLLSRLVDQLALCVCVFRDAVVLVHRRTISYLKWATCLTAAAAKRQCTLSHWAHN